MTVWSDCHSQHFVCHQWCALNFIKIIFFLWNLSSCISNATPFSFSNEGQRRQYPTVWDGNAKCKEKQVYLLQTLLVILLLAPQAQAKTLQRLPDISTNSSLDVKWSKHNVHTGSTPSPDKSALYEPSNSQFTPRLTPRQHANKGTCRNGNSITQPSHFFHACSFWVFFFQTWQLQLLKPRTSRYDSSRASFQHGTHGLLA